MKFSNIKKLLNTLKDLDVEVLIIAIDDIVQFATQKIKTREDIEKKIDLLKEEIKEFNNYLSEAGAYKFNENDMFNYEKLALVENKYDRTIY